MTLVIFEDDDIRVEAHVTTIWIAQGTTRELGHTYYRCGERWANGNECDSISVFNLQGHACTRVYAKEKPVKFICNDCAQGDHTQCTKSNCDCQHRTEDSNG